MDLCTNQGPTCCKRALRPMVLITLKYPHPWLLTIPVAYYFLLLIQSGPFSSQMSKILSTMVIYMRKAYMEQTPKYVAQGESIICKAMKVIYELKQIPQAQFGKLSTIIFYLVFRGVNTITLISFSMRLLRLLFFPSVENILMTESEQKF